MRNMYCGSPLCVPSRMALLSGLLPDKTGIYTNFHSLPSEQPTFVHSLAAAGYRTVLAGRMHFNGPDQRHGFQERLVGDITPVRFDQGYSPDWGVLGGTSDQSRTSVEKSGAGTSSVIAFDQDVSDAAVETVSTYDEESPLFLTVGFYGPHCPFVCPRDLFDYYYERVDIPRYPEKFKSQAHPFIQRWHANRGLEELPQASVRRAVAAYHGLVELTDRHVGRIVRALRANPRLENTMIVYASDHGEMAGDKGLFWKSSFYDGSARVPCIVSGPGISPGQTIAHPLSLLDLGATFIEAAGGLPLPRMDGQSLLPLLRGTRLEDSERAVFSILGDMKRDAPGAMIRRGPWKLVIYHGYEHPQLFHMEEDPHELNDLGIDPETIAVRKELLAALAPRWNGKAIARKVGRMREISEFWSKWRESAPPEENFETSWNSTPEQNHLEQE